MNSITIIIKVTGACNLRCLHCYNAKKSSSNRIISTDVLERLFRITLSGEYDKVLFIWHGGEPLLAGKDFYNRVIELQKQYASEKINVENAIQTNGLLLDDTFINLLYDNHFRLGISYDGSKNSILRERSEELEEIIDSLISNKRPFGALTTICSQSLPYLPLLYEEFNAKQIGWKFGPIFNSGRASENKELLVDYLDYAEEIIKLIPKYVFDKKGKIRVSNLDSYLNLFLLKERQGCIYNSCMYRFLSIEPDGTLYPCGRYYPPSFIIGNIQDYSSVTEVFSSAKYEAIVKQAITRREKCRHSCDIYKYCQGGCNNNALIDKNMTEMPRNYCQSYRKIVCYTRDFIDGLSKDQLHLINPILQDTFKKYFHGKQQ